MTMNYSVFLTRDFSGTRTWHDETGLQVPRHPGPISGGTEAQGETLSQVAWRAGWPPVLSCGNGWLLEPLLS